MRSSTRTGTASRSRSTTLSRSVSSTTSRSGSRSTRLTLSVSASVSWAVTKTPKTTSCPPGYAGSTCEICGPGKYSSSTGSQFCTRCPAGVYGSSSGLTTAACSGDCVAAPGYFCPSGATHPSQVVACNVGAYCAGGSAINVSCYPVAACAVSGLGAQPPCVWDVSTLAGSGTSGYGDNVVGTSAAFSCPTQVVRDLNGTFYILDYYNAKIRRISPGGAVTTVYSTSGADPKGLVLDHLTGTLYYSSGTGKRLWQITSSGAQSIIAGTGAAGYLDGAALSSSFRLPVFLSIGVGGALIIADAVNHCIRSFLAGTVSTLAGNGTAAYFDGPLLASSFSFPTSAVVHQPTGIVYVSDTGNKRIRAFSNTLVYTVAGNGTAAVIDGFGTEASFVSPSQLLIDSVSNTLYVSENSPGNTLRSISLLTMYVKTIAGCVSGTGAFLNGIGNLAAFSYPQGFSINPSGEIFLADSNNNRIRRLTCVPCPASYFCSSGTPVLCTKGSYCPLSSVYPTPCPSGTYNPTTGASSINFCRPCSYPGSICPPGSTNPSYGSFCAPGQVATVNTFSYSAQIQWYNASNILHLYVQLWGAGAGSVYLPADPASGGGGAYVAGWLNATYVGIPLMVMVGNGVSGSSNGGGICAPVMRGASPSAIQPLYAPEPAVAGAGGSGGQVCNGTGATWDGSALFPVCCNCVPAATSGTFSMSGTGGFANGASGYSGTGPLNLKNSNRITGGNAAQCGGPGGGGYFGGGGGGWWNGGGSGSSYLANLVNSTGFSAILSVPGGIDVPNYAFPVGYGTKGNAGTSGAVVLTSCMCGGGYFFANSSCYPCPSGTFSSLAGSLNCTQCTEGSYCPFTSYIPTLCTPGSFSSAPGASLCTPCLAGTYTPSPGQKSCRICEPGYFCPSNSSTMTPCGLSNYCPRGSSSPIPCPIFMAVDAALGPANGPAFDVDTAACLAHCYSGGPDQTSRC